MPLAFKAGHDETKRVRKKASSRTVTKMAEPFIDLRNILFFIILLLLIPGGKHTIHFHIKRERPPGSPLTKTQPHTKRTISGREAFYYRLLQNRLTVVGNRFQNCLSCCNCLGRKRSIV